MTTSLAGSATTGKPLNHPGHADQKSHGRRKRPPAKQGAERDRDYEAVEKTLKAAPAGLDRTRTGLSRPQREALREYQSAMYVAFNGQIRRGDVSPTTARKIKHIDDAMESSRLTEDVYVWRGARNGPRMFGDRLDGNLTGMRWREDSYTSTSAVHRVARGFTYPGTDHPRPVLMQVKVPKGAGAVQVSGQFNQAELLLQRGMDMKVTRDHGVSPQGYRLIEVEAIPT